MLTYKNGKRALSGNTFLCIAHKMMLLKCLPQFPIHVKPAPPDRTSKMMWVMSDLIV